MSRPILAIDEAIAILKLVETPPRYIDAFTERATFAAGHKNRRTYDAVTVGSGFGQQSQQGHVELIINDEVTQMDVRKAKEIGLMLIEAAEAATSDQMLLELLEQMGLPPEARGQMLLKLREIRQGSRQTVHPS